MASLTLPALVTSLACALALAAADYFRKSVPPTVATSTLLFYFFAAQLPLLGLWLAVDSMRGTADFSAMTAGRYWGPGFADAVASLAGNALFIVALRRSPMGMVVPLLSFIPVFTLVSGIVVLGEWPTTVQALGILFTAAGVFCIYQPPDANLSPSAVWRTFRAEPGALPMIGVALAWALTAPLDKIASRQAGVSLHGVAQVALLCAVMGGWVWMSSSRRSQDAGTQFRVPRHARGLLAWAAITCGLAYVFQLLAYQMTLVAFVEAIKRGGEIVTVLAVSVVLLGERLHCYKVIGAGLVVGGIPMMVLSNAPA
jgi:drug/metabolite transporter (DMT)-like permease